MRLWAFSVFGELGCTRTSQELHKRSMSCWHRTSNLWPSGTASRDKQPPQLPLWLSNLVCSRISHMCVLCVWPRRKSSALPEHTYRVLYPRSIQHVWPCVGQTEQRFWNHSSITAGTCSDAKAVLSCQVLCEDRNICAIFDRTLQMADDYITASRSEASCLCIVRTGYELLIFSSEVEVKWWSCRSEISPVQLYF